jgi:hypothetical protein
MVIVQELLCGLSEMHESRTMVPPEDSGLPQGIEAFHRGIATGFSLRNKDKVDPQEQMEAYDLGKAIGIAASARSGHLVVHLRDPGETQE